MFLPCRCDKLEPCYGCDFVIYHPQDIVKGQKIAVEEGLEEGIIYAHKLCPACKWSHGHTTIKDNIWDTVPI